MKEQEIELLLSRPTLIRLDDRARNEIRIAAREYSNTEPSYEDPKLDVAQLLNENDEFSKTVLKPILSKFHERQRLDNRKNQKNKAVRKLKWTISCLVGIIVFVVILTRGA